MDKVIRIGTRDSQLAVWQAAQVKDLLERHGIAAALVPVKSEGDIDLKTPLYAMGVQGVFTRTLDIALLNDHIDMAVHSMKDVPTQPAAGIIQAAVLERGPVHDLLVYKQDTAFLENNAPAVIATSSVRRRAQWLHRYPHHRIENLRGNVNTRLQKLASSSWNGAIFAAAGLERIGLRPADSLVLHWMLPAPAQGAIMVACREENTFVRNAAAALNHPETEICTAVERNFLRALMGGCSTPISAYAYVRDSELVFNGSICSPDGSRLLETSHTVPLATTASLGETAAEALLQQGAAQLLEDMHHVRR